jgi:DNA-binding beta-propeller fold protein YncE
VKARGPRTRDRGSNRVAALATAAVLTLLASGMAGWLLWSDRGSDESASSMRVETPAFVREFRGNGPGALRQPVGIAIAGAKVFVADVSRGDVAVFTNSGLYESSLGAGRLRRPVYVALSPLDGRLYVSDRASRSIEVFGVDGAFIETFRPADAAGERAIQGWQPFALAFGDDGALYVADVGTRQRVITFGPTGDYRGETGDDIPRSSSGEGLAYANGLAVSRDEVVVADSNNSRLLFLTRQLRFLRVAPFAGLPRGALPLRGGLTAVVNTTEGELAILGPGGAVLARGGSKGSARGQLTTPAGIAADDSGRVFVTDTGGARVSVWIASGASRRDLLLEALADTRWWVVVVGTLLAAGLAVAAVVVGRNRRSTI